MSIYYKDYEYELWLTANNSGTTGMIDLSSDFYTSVLIYWQIKAYEKSHKEFTVHDEISIPISEIELQEFHKKQIEKIKKVMTCPIEELPLYINDIVTKHIAIKRLKEGV